MQPAPITWQQLQPLYNQLLNAIGTGISVNRVTYETLMNNLGEIPQVQILEYRRAVVSHLLTLVGQTYTYTENLHPGDVLEEQVLGIPRENNVKIGDLLGLELKTFTGSSPLSLTSFSCVRDLVAQIQGANGLWDVVWFPTHVRHAASQPQSTHHLRANENLRNNELNEFGNLTLSANGADMIWHLQPGNQVLKRENLSNLFEKYSDGILLLDITGTKANRQFTINQIYFDPSFTPAGIGQHFIDENIKFEIRYDFSDKVNGLWTRDPPRNTGHAFRMTVGTVKREIMASTNKINNIGDFP